MVWNAFMEDEEIQALNNPSCPECKSNSVALIFWGYPADMDWYLKACDAKEITPGGCCVSDNDPKWACNDCCYQWGKRDDD
jgi:hypothetical protein